MKRALIGLLLLALAGGKVTALHARGWFDNLGIAFPLNISFRALTSTAHADGKAPAGAWLDSLPPMPAEERAAFDKAAGAMYRQDCNCLVFVSTVSKKIETFPLPLSDAERRLFIIGISNGTFIPVESGSKTF